MSQSMSFWLNLVLELARWVMSSQKLPYLDYFKIFVLDRVLEERASETPNLVIQKEIPLIRNVRG